MRRILRVAVVFIGVLAIGLAILMLTGRPRLENAQSDVDAAWAQLAGSNEAAGPLDDRFHALNKTYVTVESVDAAKDDRTIYTELERALNRWGVLRRDPVLGPPSANHVEALANRLRAIVLGSPKLQANPTAVQAFAPFDAAAVPAGQVSAYNDAVNEYQKLREDTITGIVAKLLGYDARVQYEGPTSSG